MPPKLFTVKDFITYNNPCFSCNHQINFRIGFFDLETKADVSYLRPSVTSAHTEVDLLITYKDVIKLLIFHETNKIATNNLGALTKYLRRHKLFLRSTCDRCYTKVESRYLDFNLEKGLVGAVSLLSERLVVSDKKNLYQIDSLFMIERSTLMVNRLDKTQPLSPTILELSLLPKYCFRDRQHFIEKCNLYVLFS